MQLTPNNPELDYYKSAHIFIPYIQSCNIEWSEPSNKDNSTKISPFILYDADWLCCRGKVSMLLKDLKKITDEDLIDLYKLEGNLEPSKDEIDYLRDRISLYDADGMELGRRTVQFLYTKGYALPYLNYSIKDLIGMGFYKIIE